MKLRIHGFGGAAVLAMAAALLVAGKPGAAVASDRLLAQIGKPKHGGLVHDYAGALDGRVRSSLETTLQELNRKTGAEVAVVVLPGLDGGEIQDFSNRLFEQWGVGRKGKDDGALMVVALEDRKVWVEVGYGLEGALPDGKVGRILDTAVVPQFRAGRVAEGVTLGALELAQVVAAERGVELSGRVDGRRQARRSRGSNWLGLVLLIIMIPVFIRHPYLLLLLLSSGRGGGFSGGGFGGGFGGFGGGLSGGGGAGRSW